MELTGNLFFGKKNNAFIWGEHSEAFAKTLDQPCITSQTLPPPLQNNSSMPKRANLKKSAKIYETRYKVQSRVFSQWFLCFRFCKFCQRYVIRTTVESLSGEKKGKTHHAAICLFNGNISVKGEKNTISVIKIEKGNGMWIKHNGFHWALYDYCVFLGPWVSCAFLCPP